MMRAISGTFNVTNAVAGENDEIARLQSNGRERQVNQIDLFTGYRRAQHMTAGIATRFFCGYFTFGHQAIELRRERMIFVELRNLAAAKKVERTVADADPGTPSSLNDAPIRVEPMPDSKRACRNFVGNRRIGRLRL